MLNETYELRQDGTCNYISFYKPSQNTYIHIYTYIHKGNISKIQFMSLELY